MPAKKTKKTEQTEEKGTFSANLLLNCSDKRADEIIKAFRHAMVDHDTWTDVVKQVIEVTKAETPGDFAYIGYIFGRKYEEHDNAHNPMGFLEHLLKHH